MLWLAQTRDEALAEAAEGKALAEQSALDGLLEGVVDGVLGWVTGSSDARTAYSITAIGLTTARDVAVRTAFAAFDVAAIERGAEAERLAATANKNRIISDVQAYRDEVANSPASNSTPPLDPSIMQPGLLPSEMAQLHAENRARDRSNTLTEWGVTALRSWIATVDASGVLNASTTTTTTSTANGATGPGANGPSTTGPGTNGSGTNGAGNDWRTQLQNALSQLQALTGDDSTGTTNGSEPGGNGPGGDGTNPPTTNGDGSGSGSGSGSGVGGDGGNPVGSNPPATGAPPVGGTNSSAPGGGDPPPGNGDPVQPPPLSTPGPRRIWIIDGKPYTLSPEDAAAYDAAVERSYSYLNGLTDRFAFWQENDQDVRRRIEAAARQKNLIDEQFNRQRTLSPVDFEAAIASLRWEASGQPVFDERINNATELVTTVATLGAVTGPRVIQKSQSLAIKLLSGSNKGAKLEQAQQLVPTVQKGLKAAGDAVVAKLDKLDDAAKSAPDAVSIQNAIAEAPNTSGGRFARINPSDIRFSQSTAGGNGRAARLRESIRNGWNGPAVSGVQTTDGIVTIDNTRIAIAREFGLSEVPVMVRQLSDPLPDSMIGRFGDARTWGEALQFRTGHQIPPLTPTGTSNPPRLP